MPGRIHILLCAALVAAGHDEVNAGMIVHGGGKTIEEATALAESVWIANLDSGKPEMFPGRSSVWNNMTQEQRQKWEEFWKAGFIKRVSVPRTGGYGDGALPPQISDDEAAQNALRESSGAE